MIRDSIQNMVESLHFNNIYFGNTGEDYVTAFLVFVAFALFFKLLQWAALRKLAKLAEKTETDIDDTLIEIVRSLRPGFYLFLAFFFAVKKLELSSFATEVVGTVLIIWIAFQVVIALQILIDYIIDKKFTNHDEDGEAEQGIIHFMSGMAKSLLWVVAALMVLSNLGINVGALVAGLGIGGLAIAFALQGVFADLFAAFSIYLDKPFMVGDYIVIGKQKGTIEKIGIKSTRLRAPQGEELVISNQELTNARIQNFKKLKERRISTQLGVTYDTTSEQLKNIPDMIKKIVDEEEGARLDRIHFSTFGDSALLFDIVYYVESDQYGDYMDVQQNMNLKIKEAFEADNIDMAFPTQTIHLAKS